MEAYVLNVHVSYKSSSQFVKQNRLYPPTLIKTQSECPGRQGANLEFLDTSECLSGGSNLEQLALTSLPSPSSISGTPMVAPQPTFPHSLHSSLVHSCSSAAPLAEVDQPGVLCTLRTVHPGQRSMHTLEVDYLRRNSRVGHLE